MNIRKFRHTVQTAFGIFLVSISSSVFPQNARVGDLSVDLQLAANDDGSLSSSDPDAMMPIRLKKK